MAGRMIPFLGVLLVSSFLGSAVTASNPDPLEILAADGERISLRLSSLDLSVSATDTERGRFTSDLIKTEYVKLSGDGNAGSTG